MEHYQDIDCTYLWILYCFKRTETRTRNQRFTEVVLIAIGVVLGNMSIFNLLAPFLHSPQRKLFTLFSFKVNQKVSSFFSSDFESMFAYHLTGKILSFEFYPKAVYFECKFWILRSAITRVQN